MKQETITNLKKKYYTKSVIERLMQEVKFDNCYREVAVLNNVKNGKKIAFRGITFSNIGYFRKTFFNQKIESLYNYLNNDSNMYVSVARIKQLPRFSFSDRTKETKPFFESEYSKYIVAYDLFLDFDFVGDNFYKFLGEIETIVHLIKEFELKAEVVFSGYRGFKILIYNNAGYSLKTIKRLVPKIKEKYKMQYLDTAGYFVPSKLMKLNFSLVFKDNSCKVALPLKNYNWNELFKIMYFENSFAIFNYNGHTVFDLVDSDFLREYSAKGFKNFVRYILK